MAAPPDLQLTPDRSLRGARWELRPADAAAALKLARTAGLHPVLARCLAVRGTTDPHVVGNLLRPRLEDLHDPLLMLGMPRALDRLARAVRDREPLRVVTDYDVDGTTSSLILQATLRTLGHEGVSYHIPSRMGEGYGFSMVAAEQAAADGIRLIVTADIGVRDHAAVTRAAELGLDVLVLDHHLPGGASVPSDAYAVLCPPQVGCDYPNQALAACGVSLKVAQALLATHPRRDGVLRSLLKLAAIGTVADVVDLSTPENRAIVALGLGALNEDVHAPGLAALMKVAGVERGAVDTHAVGYRLAPRINAAGRIDDAALVVELLNGRDPARSAALAQRLDELNRERRAIQEQLVVSVTRELAGEPPPMVVAWGPEEQGWHRGVVGVVAAKVRDAVNRPAAIVAVLGDRATGSVRSTPEIDAVALLDRAQDLLVRYGGHPAAAGFTVPTSDLPMLRERLQQAASDAVGGNFGEPLLRADAAVGPDDADLSLEAALHQLQPYGKGNPPPLLWIRDGTLGQVRELGSGHLRGALRGAGGRTLELTWWNGWAHAAALQPGPWEFMGSLERNTWRGGTSVRLVVEDARRAG